MCFQVLEQIFEPKESHPSNFSQLFNFSSSVMFLEMNTNQVLWSLVEIAWTFYMLHGNMQANFFLQNMENSGSLHENIL